LLAISLDGFSFAQCLAESLAQADTDIFYRVMLIDPKITLGLQLEVEAPMGCKKCEHVVQKPH
jgi:hypothetical protein